MCEKAWKVIWSYSSGRLKWKKEVRNKHKKKDENNNMSLK